MLDAADSTDVIVAWQCIGCGRIEDPQPCLGVCQDQKVRLVYAKDHEKILVKLRGAEIETKMLEALVRRIALATPRAGEWERSYRWLQDEARRAVTALTLMRTEAAEAQSAASGSESEEP